MGKFFAGPLGSWLRVFVATALTLWLADLVQGAGWVFNWEEYCVAGLVAVLPIIAAWCNPADTRFGLGSGE